MAIIGSLLNLTNGAALGTSPGAISQAAASDDNAGAISTTSGTGPTTGPLCSFDLGTSYSDIYGRGSPIILVGGGNAATAALGLYVTVTNGVHVVISCTVAPAASTALAINYQTVT